LKPEYAKTQIHSVKCEGDFCLVKEVWPEEDIKGSYDLNDAILGHHVADIQALLHGFENVGHVFVNIAGKTD
jgi:hypothetical protein